MKTIVIAVAFSLIGCSNPEYNYQGAALELSTNLEMQRLLEELKQCQDTDCMNRLGQEAKELNQMRERFLKAQK